ncbi:MAG: choice-of-anchor B family protein [Bacteroidota bacterium]
MKILYALLFPLLFLSQAYTQSPLNLQLFGQANRGDSRYSGCWTYVAPGGTEYALIGTFTGTAIYDISEANELRERGYVPGPSSNWREITVIGDYAYVTTEGSGNGSGMQVLDLRPLPDSIQLLSTFDSTFTRGHIIQRDIYTEAPYVYISGTSTTQGVHILDVSDPAQPVEVGLYNPGYYIHDCHVNGDLLFAAAFFEGKMDVIDISDKSQPTFLTDIPDINGNTHSSWLSEDRKFLFLASELDGTPGRIFNIEDLDNIFAVATYSANLQSLVHNPYVRGDFAFISHNTEGLRVVDIADPNIPVEVGAYDTFSGSSGGFRGLWSACPYLPSGKIIGGNREDGLYVWTFNDARAGRLCGQVLDAATDQPISNAIIIVEESGDTLRSDFEGRFCWGALPGSYTLRTSSATTVYTTDRRSINLMAGSFEDLIIRLDRIVATDPSPPQLSPRVYPNPASDRCELTGVVAKRGWSLHCRDLSGRLVRRIPVGADGQFRWSVADWERGVYLYQVVDREGRSRGGGKLLVK